MSASGHHSNGTLGDAGLEVVHTTRDHFGHVVPHVFRMFVLLAENHQIS